MEGHAWPMEQAAACSRADSAGGGDDAGFLHLLDRSHPTEASCAGDDANIIRGGVNVRRRSSGHLLCGVASPGWPVVVGALLHCDCFPPRVYTISSDAITTSSIFFFPAVTVCP